MPHERCLYSLFFLVPLSNLFLPLGAFIAEKGQVEEDCDTNYLVPTIYQAPSLINAFTYTTLCYYPNNLKCVQYYFHFIVEELDSRRGYTILSK